MAQLKLGQTVVTRGIDEKMKEDESFKTFVQESLSRHATYDWGDVCEEDRQSNNQAIANDERILSVYTFKDKTTKIWIITERDRSVTTVLFPDEY